MSASLHSILRGICLLAAAAGLAAAYGPVSVAVPLIALPAMLAFWLLARRRSVFWTSSSLLAAYLGLAAVAIIQHASGLAAATGCVFALAAWELGDPRGLTTAGSAGSQSPALETRRLQSLAIVTVASLALITLASSVRLQLPFGVIALLAVVAVGCIAYAVRYAGRVPASERRE